MRGIPLRNSGLARHLSREFKRKKFGKPQMRLILMAVSVGVLILLMVILIPRLWKSEKATDAGLADRIRSLERKLSRIEAIEKRIAKIEAQNAGMAASIMDRVDRMEKSILFKMDQLKEKTGSDALEASAVIEPRGKTVDIPPPAAKPVRYHKVKAGDTLYGISRTYGLSLDELKRINKLGPNTVLHTGQELIIE